MSAPRDTAVGSLFSSSGNASGNAPQGYVIDCTPDANQDRDVTLTFTVSRRPVPGFTDVYPTNLDGVGIRYNFRTSSCAGWGVPNVSDAHIGNSSQILVCHLLTGTAVTQIFDVGSSAEFVKTGPITGGQLTSIPAITVSYSLNNQTGTFSLLNMYAGNATGTFVVPTCTTPNVSVAMGSRRISEFNGVGSTTPAKSFNLSVNDCPTGMSRIRYQFSPAAGVSASTDGTVPLDNSALTATGVGMKLTDDDNVALAWNTWYVLTAYNATNGGSFTVPLKAAYIQTDAAIGPGTANTSVLFTMSYE